MCGTLCITNMIVVTLASLLVLMRNHLNLTGLQVQIDLFSNFDLAYFLFPNFIVDERNTHRIKIKVDNNHA